MVFIPIVGVETPLSFLFSQSNQPRDSGHHDMLQLSAFMTFAIGKKKFRREVGPAAVAPGCALVLDFVG